MATSPKASKVKPDPTLPRKALKVISSQPGFRRAGYAFGPEPVTIPLDELSPEQVEAIENEPKLVAVEVELPPEQASDDTASKSS